MPGRCAPLPAGRVTWPRGRDGGCPAAVTLRGPEPARPPLRGGEGKEGGWWLREGCPERLLALGSVPCGRCVAVGTKSNEWLTISLRREGAEPAFWSAPREEPVLCLTERACVWGPVTAPNRYRQHSPPSPAPPEGPSRGTSVLKLCNSLTFVLHQCISAFRTRPCTEKAYLRRGEDEPLTNCASLCSP